MSTRPVTYETHRLDNGDLRIWRVAGDHDTGIIYEGPSESDALDAIEDDQNVRECCR